MLQMRLVNLGLMILMMSVNTMENCHTSWQIFSVFTTQCRSFS